MRELNQVETDIISGGQMSTQTRITIGVAFVVCPLAGIAMLAGYYA